MAFIILGLGSNVGDRAAHLVHAAAKLRTHISGLRISSTMESAALLPEGAPAEWNTPYYNIAVCGETEYTPQGMLQWLKTLELELGRTDRGYWGPREIDIDILLYDDVVLDTAELCIPHRGMLKRDFALKPAAEIAPDAVHPLAKKTLRELAAAL